MGDDLQKYIWYNLIINKVNMKKYEIRSAGKKGQGLFATKDIKKGEIVIDSKDAKKQKTYSATEIIKNYSDNNHVSYVGRGRYIVDTEPGSYMNHACNPNIVIKNYSMKKCDYIALRDINPGEELTHDYGVSALESFGKTIWVLDCKCGSKNCRKKIPSDFFKQPKEVQRNFYRYLPPSVKRKFRDKFNQLLTN
jgi:hypothetical protein